MSKLGDFILNAGLSKAEFDTLKDAALEENSKNLRTYSLVMVLVFAGLLLLNALSGGFASINQYAYLLLALGNLLIWLGVRFVATKHPSFTLPLCYLFMAFLYAFALHITLLHPEYPAVSAIVVMVVLPFVFIDRPLRLAFGSALAVAVFCVLVYLNKSRALAKMDIWNGITFGALSIAVETLQQRSKYRMLSQARHIRYLSETDLLTGAKNRNHYENRLDHYVHTCRENLICLYADVNGLHELNNSKGHRAGDAMLKAVAHALIDAFGTEHTYRIGGDEFVCFRVDAPEAQARQDAARIGDELAKIGYHISVGVASQEKSWMNMRNLTGSAEDEMYQAKREYYVQAGKDRRRR